ncbi:MAG TPA: diadenylate cyclase, partial [Pirellulaceae bacterium]|nr:diadenylate cyclase [Pirellulaceae bacterium]
IGVIALLLYCTLSWLRQRASKSLVISVALVVGLFLCARWLDMYLTTMLFQAGFMAILVTLIVVFQQDIRRAFERVAASGWFGHQPQATVAAGAIATLVESVILLAEQRTGALLVFEGREPLDRHIRGGIPVDGCLSLPLLCSIFHPQSPGHDGAMLIRGERIERMGVHLPLSNNLAEVGGGGTRHAAALGLAERCDALIVVISEERGTISIAEQGELREIRPAELTSHLERYYEACSASPQGTPWQLGLKHNLGLKLAALLLASGLWLLFAYRVETIQRTFVVPIEYRNLPENWVIDEPRRTRAELTLAGSERALDMLDASSLAVSFELSHVRSETPYSLRTESSLKGVPDQLSVNQIQPREVQLTVRRKPVDEPQPNLPASPAK